jgi:hypothetical protein
MNYARAERCWLCGATLPLVEGVAKLAQPALRQTSRAAAGGPMNNYSLASLLLMMTLACVVLGVFSIAPGLGVPLGVIAFLAWMRTFHVVRARAIRGDEVTANEKIGLFVWSFGNTLVLLTMIIVAAGAAFFTACTTMLAIADPREPALKEILPIALFALIVFLIFAFGIVRMIRANRRRWRRDVGEPDALGIPPDDKPSK